MILETTVIYNKETNKTKVRPPVSYSTTTLAAHRERWGVATDGYIQIECDFADLPVDDESNPCTILILIKRSLE